jgi:hypothetical protein
MASKRKLFAVFVGAAALGVAGVAYATIPGPDGVIHGCYKNGNGTLRVINADAGQACKRGETAIFWTQTDSGTGQPGPQGPPGPIGPHGPKGDPGESGTIEDGSISFAHLKKDVIYDADVTVGHGINDSFVRIDIPHDPKYAMYNAVLESVTGDPASIRVVLNSGEMIYEGGVLYRTYVVSNVGATQDASVHLKVYGILVS